MDLEQFLRPLSHGHHQLKDATLSSQVRNEGNKFYTKKSHDAETHRTVLGLYNKSIALAIENSEEQALAYSNRSALLLHLHKHEECLIDIDRAQKITQSPHLKNKLLLRKEKCLEHQLKPINCKDNEKIESWNSVQTSCNFNHMETEIGHLFSKLKITDELSEVRHPKLLSASKNIPCFSDAVYLKNNERYGRHVVATRDIKPGEILAVEECFFMPVIDKIYLVCSFCSNFTWNGVPCPNCVFAFYCSEKCKMNAWQEHHDIECSIPLFNENYKFSCLELLSIRLFIKFVKNEGLQKIIDQATSLDFTKSSDVVHELPCNQNFDSTKFKFFYSLKTNVNDYLKKKNYYHELGLLSMALLSEYTSILKNAKDLKRAEILHQVEKIIIKIMMILEKNSYQVDNGCNFTRKRNCVHKLSVTVATYCSFFNHSCAYNVDRVFCKDKKIMIFSVHPIKKNEQLLISYSSSLVQPKKERQASLERYDFTCNCEACENNWNFETFQMHPTTLGVILKEAMEFKKDKQLKMKNAHDLTLAVTVKLIELIFKYHNNLRDAYLFGLMFFCRLYTLLSQSYGINAKVPTNC